MSYDLYFTKPRITREQFTAYFDGRENWEVTVEQCVYQNPATGVYFLIDFCEPDEDDTDEQEAVASLSLNYYRPHVFGLEAVDEVAAFVEHFGFSIFDPQIDGMADGPFSKEGFLKGWNLGNEFGYSAILGGDHPPETVWTLPGETLEANWRWNFEKPRVQAEFSEDRFVPSIFYWIIGGQVASVAVWPDAIPELIPQVDFLVIGRDELAPKSFFGKRKTDQILLPFEHIHSDLEPYATADFSLPAFLIPAPFVPDRIEKRIRDLKPTGFAGEGITVDQVLNREIVAKYQRS